MNVMIKGFEVPYNGQNVLQNRVKTINICYSSYKPLDSIRCYPKVPKFEHCMQTTPSTVMTCYMSQPVSFVNHFAKWHQAM